MKNEISEICLFIYNPKSSDNIFISNGDGGEESRLVERQRERERVCERQHMVEKER
jgi:hypothetical protein